MRSSTMPANTSRCPVEFPIYCEQDRVPTFVTANRIYRALLGRLNPLPENKPGQAEAHGSRRAARIARLLLERHTRWNEISLEPFLRHVEASDRFAFGRFGDVNFDALRREAAA